MREVVGRTRAKFAGVRIIGATLTSALGSTNANHGSREEDTKRKALNEFTRNGGLFDGVADFGAATLDPQTGGMRAESFPKARLGAPRPRVQTQFRCCPAHRTGTKLDDPARFSTVL